MHRHLVGPAVPGVPTTERIPVCDSAGVMYWSDSKLLKMEKANLDGTGRTVLLNETKVNCTTILLHGGNVYFTAWHSPYRLILYCQLSHVAKPTVRHGAIWLSGNVVNWVLQRSNSLSSWVSTDLGDHSLVYTISVLNQATLQANSDGLSLRG